MKLGMVAHACTLAFRKTRQADLEFKANLGYVARPCSSSKRRHYEVKTKLSDGYKRALKVKLQCGRHF